MKRFLRQVTITGADDSVSYYRLFEISKQFPFVEWGILLSKNSEGYFRFPSWKWIEGLITEKPASVTISGHLCGSWVRDIVAGGSEFLNTHRELSHEFARFQLNFHGQVHIAPSPEKFIDSLVFLTGLNRQPVIFQLDGVYSQIYSLARGQYARHRGIEALALHDVSGGAGILPEQWPQPMGDYCGYAGGLSPDNLAEQLKLIQDRIRNKDGSLYPIWIDAETHIRSTDNSTFETVKAEAFLGIAEPFVTGLFPRMLTPG